MAEQKQQQQPVKKFLNDKDDVVKEALQGLCLSNPELVILKGKQTITLRNQIQNKVTLLCGGGSGHEPAHAGFVDEKMLQAAVCGGVFASPSYQQVLGAIQHVATPEGVLVIIKNYTGDVINFELASGFAKSQGINVKTLIVKDDIAFLKDKYDVEKIKKEARGLSATVLAYKILGGAAFKGKSLDHIHQLGEKTLNNMFSLGVSMTPCSLPGFPATFSLEQDEMEIGLGIHGEQGKGRQKVTEVKSIVKQLLEENFYKFINQGEKVVLMINNLGSCTDIEISILEREALLQLKQKQIEVVRIVSGRLMTSLEMQGVLFTIFKLESDYETEVLEYLDLEVSTKHWSIKTPLQNVESIEVAPKVEDVQTFTETQKKLNEEGQKMHKILQTLFTSLIQKEGYFNELDSIVGDGDTGSGVTRACKAVLQNLDYLQLDTQFSKSAIALGEIIANSFGGTSGPLYGNFLSQASRFLKDNIEQNSLQDFALAFQAGVQGVQDLGKAELQERTMYDILYPVSQQFLVIVNEENDSSKVITKLVSLAKEFATNVSQLLAKKGRARYLGDKVIGQKDPGCELVVEWLSILEEQLKK